MPMQKNVTTLRRALLLALGLGAMVFLAGCDIEEETLTVTTTTDGGDADPGDGICEMTSGASDCSVRAAVDEANATGGTAFTVELPPGTYELEGSDGDDANAAGDLDIDGIVGLVATGPDVVLTTGGDDRVLDLRSGVLILDGVRVEGGVTTDDGGAVRADGSLLAVVDSTFTGNTAAGSGGGITLDAGQGVVKGSTISGNLAGDAGGGIHAVAGTELDITNSTISGNTADPTALPAGLDPALSTTASNDGPTTETLDTTDTDTTDTDTTDTLDSTATASSPAGSSSSGTAVGTAPADGEGRIPVILELDVSTVPESALSGPAVARQRSAISRAAGRVAERAGLAPDDIRRTYRTLPYLAVLARPGEVDRLGDTPGVRSVRPDRLDAPTMFESVPWIGADDAHTVGTTGAGRAVAVLDSGVDADHLMADGEVIAEACFAQGAVHGDTAGDCPNGLASQTGTGAGTNCPQLSAGCWHGTHVATTAAGLPVAVGQDTLVGVAPGADILSRSTCSPTSPIPTCAAARASASGPMSRTSWPVSTTSTRYGPPTTSPRST
ncbi:MAG: hypothetical protein U5R31_07080 [Acidimicrobiia bacterium]|nr:hypothetical protein [Acidimicrobiia bacterium]